ncbi:MAG: HIT family protein [Pyrinomonadaceae bacterium]
MDILWSPWRFNYVTSENLSDKVGCPFCVALNSSVSDEEKFILYRAEHNFVILNIYPYVSGHLMVVPYRHLANLEDTESVVSNEMMELTKRFQAMIKRVYHPDGTNIGMNQGKAAGAGVAGHLHMHILPRWIGDVNFMTSISETRTIPEDLFTTYSRLKAAIDEEATENDKM